MSDGTLIVTEIVNSVTVTPVNNTVEITTGISAGSTTTAGILQLTDSVSSTSTTTAATPNAVKTAYDLGIVRTPVINPISGLYYRTPMQTQANVTVTHQRVFYTPIYIPVSTTFDRIGIATSSGFLGTSSVRLGIYNNTDGRPSTVVLDAGTVAPTASSSVYQITISQTLAAGLYWLAFCQQTAPSTASYLGTGSSGGFVNPIIGGSAATAGGVMTIGFVQDSVSGAFATATSLANSTNLAYVWIRAA